MRTYKKVGLRASGAFIGHVQNLYENPSVADDRAVVKGSRGWLLTRRCVIQRWVRAGDCRSVEVWLGTSSVALDAQQTGNRVPPGSHHCARLKPLRRVCHRLARVRTFSSVRVPSVEETV